MKIGMKTCLLGSIVHRVLVAQGWTELSREYIAVAHTGKPSCKGYWSVKMFGFYKDTELRYVRTEYTRPCITKERVRVKAVTVRT